MKGEKKMNGRVWTVLRMKLRVRRSCRKKLKSRKRINRKYKINRIKII